MVISESDVGIGNFRDPAVGDCGSVRIPCEVTDRISFSIESLFDKRYPWFLKQSIYKRLKTGRVFQIHGVGKLKFFFRIQFL